MNTKEGGGGKSLLAKSQPAYSRPHGWERKMGSFLQVRNKAADDSLVKGSQKGGES